MLRRRWFVVVGTMLVVVALVMALDLSKTPVYQASSQLLLQSKQSENIFTPTVGGPWIPHERCRTN